MRHYEKSSIAQDRMLHMQKIALELSNTMLQSRSLDELLTTILHRAIEIMPEASQGSILILNEDGFLEFKALHGYDADLSQVKIDPKESYQWRATQGNFIQPIIIDDLLEYTEDFLTDDTYTALKALDALSSKSSLSAPILIDDHFYGSINIDSTTTHVFGKEHLSLMAYFANQATIAIKNHQLYEKMLFLSKYDGLTHVYHRHYFEELCHELFEKHLQTGKIISVVLCDLNKFKSINDKYGHASGDQVLTYFAQKLRQLLSADDILARFGGDEFVAVIMDQDYNTALSRLKVICASISSEPIALKSVNHTIHCHFSYGIAQFPLEGSDLKSLIHVADARMYENKNSPCQSHQ